MLSAQDGLSTTTYHSRTLQARVDEIEGRFGKVDSDNVQLRRDKQILVEHIQQLQQKVCTIRAVSKNVFLQRLTQPKFYGRFLVLLSKNRFLLCAAYIRFLYSTFYG